MDLLNRASFSILHFEDAFTAGLLGFLHAKNLKVQDLGFLIALDAIEGNKHLLIMVGTRSTNGLQCGALVDVTDQ